VFKVSHQGKSSEGRNCPNKEKHEKNGRHPLRHRSRLGMWRDGVQWVEKKVQEKVQEGQQRIEGEVKKGKQQVKEKAQ
jgi:hypothetical protein